MRPHALAHRALAAMVLLVTAAAPSAHATRPPGTVDWPEYGFDAANTGNNPFETVLDPSNVGGIHRLWTAVLGESVQGSPALAGGVLYLCTARLHALDSGTGEELVKFARAPACESPAVQDGRVFANDLSQRLYAFDGSTGAILWAVGLGGGGSPAPPTVAEGIVYVGSSSDKVLAIDEVTGTILWTARVRHPIFGSPAIGEGRLFIESDNGRVYAFDAVTGAHQWDATVYVGGGSSSSPVYADGVVYAPGWHGERITALDGATGAVLWMTRLSCRPETPALADGILFVGAWCEDGTLLALDAATGAKLWRVSLPGQGSSTSPPSVANGVVYVSSSGGDLGIFDASNGALLKGIDLGANGSPPHAIVANGTVFVGSTSSRDEFYAEGL